ncbi:hypothetical protein Back11_32800 [Paenibacillus baekrokdamisoli]|uniref:Uncharacterized protein n=1 Tax=Paenibacillus baekrokdamisoli TaxID=1712516 RepID=A0A3G9J0Q3_9BACL|nr:hypothetical protein [Paenibacillus baekrokdamisoli]MBB3071553.1 hypothetical protein [Paenibacillus baekrokdamisoli]BBH21935.1 hypothetical protein Back11_32800 [Paenibacillus baekrokdamisoli]
MEPHALAFSSESIRLTYLIDFGLMFIIAITLWLRSIKQAQPEQFLFLKIVGYLFLSVFTFHIQSLPLPLPLGFIVAYLLMSKAVTNRSIKQKAVLLGGALFLFNLLPLTQQIDQLLYPRDQMSSYLHKQLEPSNTGFSMTILDSHNQIRDSLSEKDADAVKLYAALVESKRIAAVPSTWQPAVSIELRQEHEQERFRELQFIWDEQGRYLTLFNGETTYSFESSEAFRAIFKQKIKPYLSAEL